LTTIVGGLAVSPAATAAVQDPLPIGPNQSFEGLVNGKASNAVIQMACFGPIRPGQLGHPFAGQTTEVELGSPAAAFGFTGAARSIQATFTLPNSASTSLTELLATFGSYYAPAEISTSALFPCGGTGQIAFTPVDGGPLARPWDTRVTFVGQP
jgi:hypothetical protein